VKRARTGHVLVHPTIDGVDVGWLIFDTGAGSSTVLHRGAAARLQLTPVGAGPITSIMGTARSRILRGTSLEIGPLTVAKPFLVEMDLGFVQ
jgi:predicted aspartyl protease